MSELHPPPPLAALHGREPERPRWFSEALGHAPERSFHEVLGAPIEALSWGEVGRPGLLLMHGKMAHADWWSFIAPFFARSHRVTALSFGGMGGSGWRATYDIATMAQEALAVAHATGLHAGGHAPVAVGHSFGGFVGLQLAHSRGNELGGLVIIDTPLMSREQRAARRHPSLRDAFVPRPTRVHADLGQALARFRFAPPQPCENVFIADHIARTSLKPAPLEAAAAGGDAGPMGWTWRFDPHVGGIHPGDPARSLREAGCPVALLWGAESALVLPEVAAYMASLAPAGTPLIEIPGARHHVMVDQPLALVSALRALLAAWPPARHP